MQIHFKSREDSDLFIFGDDNGPIDIILPADISVKDLVLLIQGSLDQLRPVILLKSAAQQSEIKLSKLKIQHYKIEENKFIFLNFSIRNSFSRFDFSSTIVKNFDDIQNFFEINLKNRHNS